MVQKACADLAIISVPHFTDVLTEAGHSSADGQRPPVFILIASASTSASTCRSSLIARCGGWTV